MFIGYSDNKYIISNAVFYILLSYFWTALYVNFYFTDERYQSWI